MRKAEGLPRTPPSPDPRYRSGALFGRLWRGYLRRYAGLVALAFGLMVIEGSTFGALSYLIRPLFDQVLAPGGQNLLLWVAFAILGLFVVRAITALLSRGIMTSVAQKSSTAMQVDLLRHVLTLDSEFFQTTAPGALIERVQGDTIAVQGVWSAIIVGVGRDTVAVLSLFGVALSIAPLWTLAALVGVPLLVVPVALVQRYIRAKSRHLREQAGLRTTRLDEIFHGIQAIKLNRMEAYQSERFRRIARAIVRAEVRMMLGRAAMPSLIDITTGIGFFAVLLLGGREIASGSRTIGEFMAFFTAITLTIQPIRRLGDLSGVWQIALASLERIYRLFDTAPASPRAPATARPAPGAPEIVLQDVQFAYGDQPVLSGVSFTAEAGRMTALVGASGAGKSTIFHLLTGLAQPTAGRIQLGGVDTAALDLADLRDQFAVVSQDAALFDETIRENVAMGHEVPETDLAAALDAAHVSDFLATLPLGVDTQAGPRGSGLSGGQRQRVAIARALLRDAPVLLLDEATSALDAQSEALVAEALARLGRGRTTLVIAHRLATVRGADRIVVLDQGRVVDQGRHEELIARDGLYADLYRLQFKG